jgi:hypothetical protein
MQLIHSSIDFLIGAGISPFVTTPETASRPPGFRPGTPRAGPGPVGGGRATMQLEMMTPTPCPAAGFLDRPLQEFDVLGTGLPLVLAGGRISSVISSP